MTSRLDVRKDNFDFIDFGCGSGGSLELYKKLFCPNGKGIGIDANPHKVELALDAGFDAIVADATKLKSVGKVKFVTMHHFLEHVPNFLDVKNMVKNACNLAENFVTIRQPYFDADPYLFTKHLKLYWSNWHGHPNQMTMLELHNVLSPLVEKSLINSFLLCAKGTVEDSGNNAIHSLSSSEDQHTWHVDSHPEKPIIKFDYPIYRETLALIDIDGKHSELMLEKLKPDRIFFNSRLTGQPSKKL